MEPQQTQLPEDPTEFVFETVLDSKTISQNVHIASLAGAARNLTDISVTAGNEAEDRMVKQVTLETQAGTDAIDAGVQVTDAGYHAKINGAEQATLAAQTESVLGNSAAAKAMEASAKAVGFEEISNTQRAVEEVSKRQEIGLKDVEDRTTEGMKAEMKKAGVVAEEAGKATQDLEAQLAATAETPTTTPKMS